MPDERGRDRHSETPLTVRLGPDRQRLEECARKLDQPVRRIVRIAVRRYLDELENQP